jgi:hypothetical protein
MLPCFLGAESAAKARLAPPFDPAQLGSDSDLVHANLTHLPFDCGKVPDDVLLALGCAHIDHVTDMGLHVLGIAKVTREKHHLGTGCCDLDVENRATIGRLSEHGCDWTNGATTRLSFVMLHLTR